MSRQSKLELLAEEKVKGPPFWEAEQEAVLADLPVFWRDLMGKEKILEREERVFGAPRDQFREAGRRFSDTETETPRKRACPVSGRVPRV